METNITVKANNTPIYDIILEKNYSKLSGEFNKWNTKDKKVCIVSDTNVSPIYLNQVINSLKDYFKIVESFVFPAGEKSKNLDTVYSLYEHLITANFDRKDMLVALGGGVVGDLTGYAAATYLRGIAFMQMPTSLLAMVDSSIGGKTGVDFHAYKNMIGAFHQPKAVYMNLGTLTSLSERQYYSGMGEIIKHGLIKDSGYYAWLREHSVSIKSRDINCLQQMIYQSCIIKRNVVENDPKELGERALLNFGHTIGHAVEKLMDFKLLHGECVALGMVAACHLSYKRGGITKEHLDDIITMIGSFDLPVSVSGLNTEDILSIMMHDKKMESGKLKFILLSEIGHAVIDATVTKEEMSESIQYILK